MGEGPEIYGDSGGRRGRYQTLRGKGRERYEDEEARSCRCRNQKGMGDKDDDVITPGSNFKSGALMWKRNGSMVNLENLGQTGLLGRQSLKGSGAGCDGQRGSDTRERRNKRLGLFSGFLDIVTKGESGEEKDEANEQLQLRRRSNSPPDAGD